MGKTKKDLKGSEPGYKTADEVKAGSMVLRGKAPDGTDLPPGGPPQGAAPTAASLLSPALASMFGAPAKSVLDTMQRLNMPRMVKAVENGVECIPIGGVVAGVIVDVIKSPNTEIKGSLLWLQLVTFDDKGKPTASKEEISFPATGVIRNALAPGEKGEENARVEMLKRKGHLICCRRQPDKLNKKFQKDMYMWDVFVSGKAIAVDLGVNVH